MLGCFAPLGLAQALETIPPFHRLNPWNQKTTPSVLPASNRNRLSWENRRKNGPSGTIIFRDYLQGPGSN
jgi:hypothetical protein